VKGRTLEVVPMHGGDVTVLKRRLHLVAVRDGAVVGVWQIDFELSKAENIGILLDSIEE